MTKAGKRFIASLVVCASLVSFVPVEFGMKNTVANAAEINFETATKISVTEGANGTGAITGSDNLYKTQDEVTNMYLVVPDVTVDENTLTLEGNNQGIIKQEIVIQSINGLTQDKWADMGVTVSTANLSTKRQIGLNISNLPLGVNKIVYTMNITVAKKVATEGFRPTYEGEKDPGRITYDTYNNIECPTLTIEHGNAIVQGQINSIDFTNYVGGTSVDEESDINVKPFKYERKVSTASDSTLRYLNDIPVSVKKLEYSINIAKNMFTYGADKIYLDGVEATDLRVEDSEDGLLSEIKGDLTKVGTSTMIVLAVQTPDAIHRSFSIEVSYGNKRTEDDYTLSEIGITKYNYNNDSFVKAQIGKTFVETTGVGNDEGIPIYSGTLQVDALSKMISMEPILGRSAENTAYKIYNEYDGGTEPSQLKNGKMYVNFNKGHNNVIVLEVYEGKDGSISGKKLAIYRFHVQVLNDTASSNVDLSFDGDVKLTQPGRPAEENIEFTADRRSYDLHSDSNVIDFQLRNPINKNEYVKAWVGSSVSSDNTKPVDVTTKDDGSMQVDVGEAKKLILQVYYDEIVYKTDSSGNYIFVDGNKVIESKTSYPIGDKYTFYISKNASIEDDDANPSNKSDDAELSNIKVKGATLKSSNGDTTGFSKDINNYEATVGKTETEANVTVTASNPNVKDISAKVVETGDEYGLESGVGFDFPLNSNGKTTLEIIVTAEDGSTTRLYTVTINNDTKNNSAELKNIILDKGDLIFDSSKETNKARVDLNVNKVKITPVVEGSGAIVTINGEEYNGNAVQVSLAGEQKTEVEIEVTAEDKSQSKTYTLIIYRTDSIIEDMEDDDDDDTASDIFYDEFDECWVDLTKYEEWGKVNGKTVYFNKKGRQVKNAWIQVDGKWYYLNSSGYKASGWKVDTDGKTYYLDPVTGEIRTGWLNINNKWYYLNLNGVMHKKWLYLNNKWYYFTQSGEMIANQTMYVDGQMYTFGPDGAIC